MFKNKRSILPILLITAILFAGGVVLYVRQSQKPDQEAKDTSQADTKTTETDDTLNIPEEIKTPTHDTTTPSSLTFIANKSHSLPANYIPSDLVTPNVRLRLGAGAEQMQFRGVATPQLEAMFDAAEKDGVLLIFGSGYRSYQLQKQFYDGYVSRDGVAAADRYSARPGTSEHQTGLSFDATSSSQTCHLEICFEDTPEGRWLAAHAHEYGFILRYPDGKEAITGYQYEPWHFRYVGQELATELHNKNQTIEAYFNVGSTY